MDRSELLLHLRKTRFAPGDEQKARAAASRVADVLKKQYGAEVYGIGSLFESIRPFMNSSDIDLVVKGIPAKKFIRASAEAVESSDFEVNLIPWETANALIREIVEKSGVKL